MDSQFLLMVIGFTKDYAIFCLWLVLPMTINVSQTFHEAREDIHVKFKIYAVIGRVDIKDVMNANISFIWEMVNVFSERLLLRRTIANKYYIKFKRFFKITTPC